MLNVFPDLLTYSMLAPFILRLVAGLIFVNLGSLAFKNEKERWVNSFLSLGISRPHIWVKILGTVEIVGGLLLFIGLYTQLVALVLALLTLTEGYIEYKDPNLLKRNFAFYTMLLAITLSLLFSSAGAFAFDLPL
ncbi:MAG TPA: DoxX family membrane protein [Candidatus Paceibacterota bacterium]